MDAYSFKDGRLDGATNPALFAAIDIGSNKVRVDIARLTLNGTLVRVYEINEACGLAHGLILRGTEPVIDRTNLQLAKHTLGEGRAEIARLGVPPQNITAVMTEALRMIEHHPQGEKDIAALREAAGLTPAQCPVISGEEEARLVAHAALLEKLQHSRFSGDVVVAAIGGGSLELCRLRGDLVEYPMALKLGSFPLRECSNNDPIAAQRIARDTLNHSGFPRAAAETVVFMGGNCRAARELICGPNAYHLDGFAHIAEVLTNTGEMTVHDFRHAGGKLAKRADAMPTAVAAMRAVAAYARAEHLVFAEATMRDGMNHIRAQVNRGIIRVPQGLGRLFAPSTR